MPITSSAKKALRAGKRKHTYNERRKDAMNGAVKTIKKLIADKKVKDAQVALSAAYQAIDKAAKTNLIKKNAASRKKSRLAAFIKKASAK
jgi:small subunit ribosomal protein S20